MSYLRQVLCYTCTEAASLLAKARPSTSEELEFGLTGWATKGWLSDAQHWAKWVAFTASKASDFPNTAKGVFLSHTQTKGVNGSLSLDGLVAKVSGLEQTKLQEQCQGNVAAWLDQATRTAELAEKNPGTFRGFGKTVCLPGDSISGLETFYTCEEYKGVFKCSGSKLECTEANGIVSLKCEGNTNSVDVTRSTYQGFRTGFAGAEGGLSLPGVYYALLTEAKFPAQLCSTWLECPTPEPTPKAKKAHGGWI